MKLILILWAAFLLLFLLERGYRRFWSRDLHVEVHFQSHPAREGEEASLTEIIENRKVLPVPMLQVEFLLDRSLGIDEEENASLSDQLYKRDVFSVSFYQKISRTIPLKCRKRGYYSIKEANLIAGGLQMEKNYYKDIPQDTFLYVYPGDVSIDRLKLPMYRLGGLLEGRRGMVEDPFAFAGMREYDGTDPMNRINWKASARSGNLMVNLQNSTYSPRVACFVDVEDVTMWKHMEIHEEAIRLAASLLRSVLKKGIPASLYTNGEDLLSGSLVQVPEGSGRGQTEKVNRSLSRLDLNAKKRPGPICTELLKAEQELTATQQVVVLITENQGEALQDAVRKMAAKGASFLWLGVFYKKEGWSGPNIHGVDYLKWEVEHEG